MKSLPVLTMILSLISCAKKQPGTLAGGEFIEPRYDTTAIDSFSAGATSIDVANQIRMSSKQYQDSLKAVLLAKKDSTEIAAKIKEDKKNAQAEEPKSDKKIGIKFKN